MTSDTDRVSRLRPHTSPLIYPGETFQSHSPRVTGTPVTHLLFPLQIRPFVRD